MKKIILYLLLISPIFSIGISAQTSIWDGTASTTWTKGTGTQSDPYLIESAANLAYLSFISKTDSFPSKYFKLTIDIDLKDKSWTPISTSKPFQGNFDGNGHIISNLSSGYKQGYRLGLFGEIKNASIQNIGIVGGFISGAIFSGSIVAYISGNATIKNCYSKDAYINATASGSFSVASGGIVGKISFQSKDTVNIINCYNTSEIYSCGTYNTYGSSSGGSSGGIVGCIEYGYVNIVNCFNLGPVEGVSLCMYHYSSAYAGGILGNNLLGDPRIENCYNRGDILARSNEYNTTSTTYATAAGIVGQQNSGDTLQNVYNTGTVSAKGYVKYTNPIIYNSWSPYENTYYINKKNVPTNIYSVKKDSVQMCAESFVTLLNVNTGVWKVDANLTNNGFPILYYPSCKTQTATNIIDTKLTLNSVSYPAAAKIISFGFEYKEAGASDFTKIECNTENIELDGLNPNTTYQYRAFVQTSDSCFYGKTLSVKTTENTSNDKSVKLVNVKVYPNPCVDFIKIDLTNEKNNWDEICILSLDNKTILTKQITEKVSFIDLKNIASGIYIIKLKNNNLLSEAIKLIKQ